MWSAHDLAHHHKLRYSKKGLRKDAEAAGLRVRQIGFFNSLLFPLAATVRLIGKALGKKDGDDKLPPRALNALFRGIFGLERHLVGRIPLPAGVSLFALLSIR